MGLTLVAAVVAGPIVAGAFVTRLPVRVVGPAPSATVPFGWQKFTSTDGGFSISGPGPAYESPVQVTSDGVTYKQVTILGTHDGAFIVYWTDYDEATFSAHSPDELLEFAVESFTQDTPGIPDPPSTSQLIGTMRCRDVVVRLSRTGSRARFCLSGRRLFKIVTRYQVQGGQDDAQHFIDSFTLIES